ncbi:MAG: MFS transporter [Christensenellales bacterium]|jgi:fucose permease
MVILLLVVIYLAFISLGLPDSLFGVAWPLMHIELGLQESFASIYMLIVGVCTASVSFLAGPIIRKLGTEWVTSVSVGLTAVGMLGIGLAQNIFVMGVFSVLLGIGAGAIDIALNDFVSKHYKASHMSWLHGFWGVGVTVSPLIMSVFLEKGGWRGGYIAMAYIQTAFTAIMFASMPLWKKVKSMYKAEANIQPDVKTKEKKRYNIFSEKGVIFAGLALAAYCGMEYIIGLWGASWLVNTGRSTAATAARYISGYFGGIMAGRFLSGVLTHKFSNKALLRMGYICASAGILLLCFNASYIRLTGLLLIGAGFAPIFPLSIDSTKIRFNPEYSVDIIGFQMGSAYAGAFIAQTGFGYLATDTTWGIFPYFLMMLMCMLIASVEIVNRKTRKTAVPRVVGQISD